MPAFMRGTKGVCIQAAPGPLLQIGGKRLSSIKSPMSAICLFPQVCYNTWFVPPWKMQMHNGRWGIVLQWGNEVKAS
jgi:hypothetical protein